jgi:hypothetical protein
LTRKAITATLFFTFAGTLLSQTVASTEQSSTTAPNLIASASIPSSWNSLLSDSARNAAPQGLLNKEAVTPSLITTTTPSVTKATFPLTASSLDHISAPKLNTIASVQDTKGHSSMVSVGPDVLPLSVRLDPNELQKYGAAPAVVQIHFGHK